MAEITREEFQKIYDEKFVPILSQLENERVEALQKGKKRGIITAIVVVVLIFLVVFIYTIVSAFSGVIKLLIVPPFETAVTAIGLGLGVYFSTIYKIRLKFKKEVLPKLLSVYGNLYFSNNPDVITLSEIKSFGLFPNAIEKSTDDVIIGVDRGCNFIIMETILKHGSKGNNVDFRGLVVKIQMNKSFNSKTVVGGKGKVLKKSGYEKVELESIDFMKNKDVYTTDQIEARYLLTTAFMERIQNLVRVFSKQRTKAKSKTSSHDNSQLYGLIDSNLIFGGYLGDFSIAFSDGFVYLFIPSGEDFFEVNLVKTLLNFEQYYKIYNELDSILSIVEYLNLDSKTGL